VPTENVQISPTAKNITPGMQQFLDKIMMNFICNRRVHSSSVYRNACTWS